MPAPFPYDGVAGVSNDSAESEAANLHAQYKWLARWSDEMNKDADLDYKKLAQFAFHCRKFRLWYETLQGHIGTTHTAPQLGDVIDGFFAMKKCRWPTRNAMNQDLQAIYDAAGIIYDWIVANMQEARQYGTISFDSSFENQTDTPVKVEKPAAVATRVQQFRGLFE